MLGKVAQPPWLTAGVRQGGALPPWLTAGVRQGGALSPCLFAVFINDLIITVIPSGKGCHLGLTGVNIIL